MVSSISYRNPFKEIELNRNRSMFIERTCVLGDVEIPESERAQVQACMMEESEASTCRYTFQEPSLRLLRYETIEADLQKYSQAATGTSRINKRE
jgi:hypothetical protein